MPSQRPVSKILRTGLVFLFLLSLVGCSSLRFPGVYRISILQGNFLDQKKIDQLNKGMTRKQAQFLIGTPLVQDTFNQNIWIYHYQIRYPNGNTKDQRLQILFENDKIVSLSGDTLPRTAEEIAQTEKTAQEALEKRKKALETLRQTLNKKNENIKKKKPRLRSIRVNRGPTR